MTVHLVTHSTRNYTPRMAPYLASLSEHSPWRNWLLTVDHDAPAEFMARFSGVTAVRVPRADGSPDPTQSLQHGAFIDHIPGPDDDVLIYTDGDMTMQRSPGPDEREMIERLPVGHVVAGYNSGPDETLALEAMRLFPKLDPSGLVAAWGDLDRPCYNVGVIAMTRGTWQAVHLAYMAQWELACSSFGDAARQQWLICHVIDSLRFPVHVPGYGFHANGHYGIPPGVSINGTANFNGEPVLFRHRL